MTEVSALGERVRVRRDGSFGVLASETATALAMVLTEVLQNAVEHGYAGQDDAGRDDHAADSGELRAGTIVVAARRLVGRLHLTVEDDGRGSAGRASTSTRRPTWGCRSCGPWWSRSSAASSRSGRRPAGRAPGWWSTYRPE